MTISAAVVVVVDVAVAAAADDIEDDGVDDGRHDDGHASKLRQNGECENTYKSHESQEIKHLQIPCIPKGSSPTPACSRGA